MGYESRLIIVDRHSKNYAEKIAEFNLSGVVWSPSEVFKKPIDFDIYGYKTREDKYGDHCKMARIKDVINIIERYEAKDPYRRHAPVLGMLKGFNPYHWDDLWVVHYGY